MTAVRSAQPFPLARVALLAVVLLAVVATTALAESPQVSGDLVVDQDLRIERGESLTIGPAAHVHGAGRILVYGDLRVEGTPGSPVVLSVPVYVFSTNDTRIAHARVDAPRGFALFVAGGSVTLDDVAFDGARTAESALKLAPTTAASVRASNVLVSGYAGAALNLRGPARVDVADSRFTLNQIGLYATLDGAAPFALTVTGSRFDANVQHARIEVQAVGAATATATFAGNEFTGATAASSALPDAKAALAVIESGTRAPRPAQPFPITSAGNRFVANPVGVFLASYQEPAGFAFTSRGDDYRANDLGLYAHGVGALVEGATFAGSVTSDVEVPYATETNAPVVKIVNSTLTPGLVKKHAGGAVVTVNGETVKVFAVGAAAATAVGLGAFLLTDVGRALAAIAFAPFYARLKPADVLANPARRLILEFVTANPGVHMRRIGHALSLSYGTLAYHLYRLEREKYLTSKEEGLFKRFYSAAGNARAKSDAGPTPTALRPIEREIMAIILAKPGSAQSAIAAELGVSRQSLHYHIKKLAAQGYIRKTPRGRETLVYATEEAVRAEAAAAAEAQAAAATAAPAATGGAEPSG